MPSRKLIATLNKNPMVNILLRNDLLKKCPEKQKVALKRSIKLAIERGYNHAKEFAKNLKKNDLPYAKRDNIISRGLFRSKLDSFSSLETSTDPLDIIRLSSSVNFDSCISLESGSHNWGLWSVMLDPLTFIVMQDEGGKIHRGMEARSICHLMGDYSIKLEGNNVSPVKFFRDIHKSLKNNTNYIKGYKVRCKKLYFVLNRVYCDYFCKDIVENLLKHLIKAAKKAKVGVLVTLENKEIMDGAGISHINFIRKEKIINTKITSTTYESTYEDIHTKTESRFYFNGHLHNLYMRLNSDLYEVEVK